MTYQQIRQHALSL